MRRGPSVPPMQRDHAREWEVLREVFANSGEKSIGQDFYSFLSKCQGGCPGLRFPDSESKKEGQDFEVIAESGNNLIGGRTTGNQASQVRPCPSSLDAPEPMLMGSTSHHLSALWGGA